VKIEDLPGQFVWVARGTPLLFSSSPGAPDRVVHEVVVKVDRVTHPTDALPALAIWSGADGERGVEARRVASQVMSLPPSGRSALAKASDAIVERLHRRRGS